MWVMSSDANMSRSRVYLDTWVLVGLVLERRGERGYFKWIIHRLDAGTIDVVVPQVVLGEAVAVVMREIPAQNNLDLIEEMLGYLRDLVDPKIGMPPTTFEVASLAMDLSKDLDLEFTDALILGHALCDPHSTHLITNDQELLSNKVEDIEIKMRNDGERSRRLSVSDNFTHR